MKRARLTKLGFDDPLVLETADDPPAPTGASVVVRVEACGVCYRDLIDRAGRFSFMQVPITPGHEAAGRVIAVGPDVREWKVGDRVGSMHRDSCGACASCARGATSLCTGAAFVLGILADGAYATHLTAPESAFYALPDELSAVEGATLHCTFGTAYRDLVTLGRLRAGERVLVTGANGGVGAAGVQIAAHLGAEVVAVVRDERHRAYVSSLGARHVVVDAGDKFHGAPAVGRVELALDTVGVSTFNSALRSLALGGRIVVVGNIVPERVSLNLGYVITSGLTIIGGSGATRADMAEVVALHRESPFRIAIDRELSLAQAEEAQQMVRAGGLQGRVVIVPGDG